MKKISSKIFLIIFSSVTFIFTLLLITQYFFIDEFYYNQKVNQIEEEVQFIVDESSEMNVDEAYNELYFLQEETGYIIDLYPAEVISEELGSNFPVFFLGEDSNGMILDVFFEAESINILSKFSEGEQVVIKGINEGDFFFATRINDFYSVDYNQNEIYDEIELEILTPVELVDYGLSTDLEKIDVNEYSDDFFYFTFEDQYSNDLTIAFQKVMNFDGEDHILYIETSLQSVSELSSVMLPYYLIFYFIGVIVSVVLSQILSKQISSPIIEITNTTNEMANMNFNQQIHYQSKDELGELSKSINFLSSKLDSTLRDLNETNHSLLKEIEKERKVEADRKTFISNVSHELKTPISISRGYLEAIKDQVNKEKHNDYIDIIYNENENMNEIVKGMLSLLKAESVSEYKMKSYEIKPILIELADYLSIQSSEKGQNFALVGDFGSAMIDLKSFKSIMLNLMTNAINYGVENSEIMIEGIITDKLQITISNHTENDVNTDELFTRFYTTDQSRNRKTSGTGLGLSIVRATLNKYNSGFNVRSEDGVFSFSFTLKTSD